MKRKIRRKRQHRIQRNKELLQKEKLLEASLLFEERMCCSNEYAAIADSSEYLYIHVHQYFGCSIYPPVTIVFLYDINRETVKYALERMDNTHKISLLPEDKKDDLNPEHYLLSQFSETRVSVDVIRKANFYVKDKMEEMFSWEEPDFPHIYDKGGKIVFLKNGKRKRRICIQDANYYSPFGEFLKFFDDVVELIKKSKKE